MVKNIEENYNEHQGLIKTAEGYIKLIKTTTTGLKQGCIFSPLLYNYHSNNLDTSFDESCNSVVINNQNLSRLFWVDELGGVPGLGLGGLCNLSSQVFDFGLGLGV